MKTYILTSLQKQVITKVLNNEFGMLPSNEEREAYVQIVKMAEEMLHELEMQENLEGSLLQWFWKRIKNKDSERESIGESTKSTE